MSPRTAHGILIISSRLIPIIQSHIAHQVLAQWAFGAHQDLLRASYTKNIPLQRPKPESVEAITSQNFNDQLGDKKYVQDSSLSVSRH